MSKLPKTWTTREGTVVKIKSMTTSHIYNCLALLLRTAPQRKLSDEFLYTFGPAPQGDMAMDTFMREFDDLLDETPEAWTKRQPQYQAFLRELAHRGEQYGAERTDA